MIRGPLRIGLRRSILLLPAGPILIAAYLIVALTSTYPAVASWANVADALSAGATLLAPVLAAATAWDATRELRSGGAPILHTTPRPLGAAILRQTAAAGLLGAALWLIVLAVIAGRAAIVGVTGAPHIALLHGLLVILLSVAIGAATAAALPGWAALPVAIVVPTLLYLAQFIDLGAPWLQLANPLRRIDTAQDDFTRIDPAWVLLRCAAIVLFVAVLVSLIAAIRGPRRLLAATSVAALIAVGVPVTAGIASSSQDFTSSAPRDELSFTSVSSETSRLTLHVLAQYTPIADELLTRWGRIATLVSTSDLAFDTLHQDDGTVPVGGTISFETFALNPASADPAAISVQGALFALVGIRCAPAENGEMWAAIGAVNVFLADDPAAAAFAVDPAELNRLVETLRAMTLTEAQAWFADHADEYLSCTLRPEDITG